MSDQSITQIQLEIGAEVSGTVKHLGMYGALVDIGTGQDALLHVSQLNQSEDATQKGSEITAYVDKIRNDGHVALSLEKPPAVPWQTIKVGDIYTGKVIRIENFGIFVDFGAERPGMVHVSEMADGYVKSPADVVSVDQEVEVRVLKKKNNHPRQIDLSMKPAVEEVETFDENENEELPTSMAQAFRRAMEDRDEDEQPVMSKKGTKRSRNEQQEDIIARTLRNAQS